ncbi:MAG: cation-translocating P-type ATPase, partial [Cytophagales bacterium]|nr:cation-translocating P-type ATPase [Rhizobacter sp.]
MKTSTIEVGELVSTLSAVGVERQLSSLPGVHHADVNYVAGSATVHYDEAKTTLDAIRQRVASCGYHCRGELVPAHVCEPGDKLPKGPVQTEHAGHSGQGATGASTDKAEMMHDMGHAPGMSMQDMANDMRKRFLVALVFAVPVFLYSPMGEMFGDLPVPFGLDRKLFLFFAATGAIAYPVWPFVVAAFRAARNKVANMATLIVLSVGTGYVFSVGATFFYEGEVFYEASAVLLVFI